MRALDLFLSKDRSPTVSLLLAVIFAALGYWHLTRGSALIGGFAWWCCGLNCEKALRGKP